MVGDFLSNEGAFPSPHYSGLIQDYHNAHETFTFKGFTLVPKNMAKLSCHFINVLYGLSLPFGCFKADFTLWFHLLWQETVLIEVCRDISF